VTSFYNNIFERLTINDNPFLKPLQAEYWHFKAENSKPQNMANK